MTALGGVAALTRTGVTERRVIKDQDKGLEQGHGKGKGKGKGKDQG